MKNTQKTETVLVTGSAHGIGYELALIFASHNFNLVLVDKDAETIKKIAEEFSSKFNISVQYLVKDLSVSTSPTEIFNQLQQAGIKIDILVNNAGFGTYGVFSETDWNTELKMLQVNIITLTHLTKLFLPDMIKQGYGKILNVASVAAFQPGPLMAVYFASKAYVLSFSEAIANELEGTGVTVTTLCPGPTDSEFQKAAAMEESKIAHVNRMMTTKTVAKIGFDSLMANKTTVIPGIRNKILVESVKFAPRNIVTKIVKNMHELRT
ncbi:MAG: SDR family oxidoreductase [Nostocales cyanobacterium]|nr:MAG: SDR family oxidoreductase [Nostocales cyanobacterium]TAF16272.1 MAG: SDR family oxidoreductase [Nostocales cyanobacterium]